MQMLAYRYDDHGDAPLITALADRLERAEADRDRLAAALRELRDSVRREYRERAFSLNVSSALADADAALAADAVKAETP